MKFPNLKIYHAVADYTNWFNVLVSTKPCHWTRRAIDPFDRNKPVFVNDVDKHGHLQSHIIKYSS